MTREEMRAHAEKLVADWPPLTAEQADRLAGLLKPVRRAQPRKSNRTNKGA